MSRVVPRSIRSAIYRWHPLVRKVAMTIRRERLFYPGHRILVAVSGGPDSVALLSILLALSAPWKLELHAVHFNYRLRGQESEDDAAFVQSLCQRLGIDVTVRRLTLMVPGQRPLRFSLQERARDARYAVMRELADELDVDCVALGHTADDQAETVLMWMLRGSGLEGLAGIPYVRERMFVRPLLDVTRKEVLSYLASEHHSYRSDSSNDHARFLRNRVRHELLPVAKRLAPGATCVLSRLARLCRDEHRFLEKLVARAWPEVVQEQSSGMVVDRRKLLRLPTVLQRRLIRGILRRLGKGARPPRLSIVESVLRLIVKELSGIQLMVGSLRIERVKDEVRFGVALLPTTRGSAHERVQDERARTNVSIRVEVPSRTKWPLTDQVIELRGVSQTLGRQTLTAGQAYQAVFDGSRLSPELTLRCWKPGDWFCPSGMKGHRKKLQDYFTDAKISRIERGRVPVLESASGILWVVGYRADERFVARPSTKDFVLATLTSAPIAGRAL